MPTCARSNPSRSGGFAASGSNLMAPCRLESMSVDSRGITWPERAKVTVLQRPSESKGYKALEPRKRPRASAMCRSFVAHRETVHADTGCCLSFVQSCAQPVEPT